MKPRLIIVTICYNNLNDLIKTCESVDYQTVLPDEHWIIDGSTNEEILTWLSTKQHSNFRHFVHERDGGISDAFNKGILRVKDGMIQLLNAGDVLFNASTLEQTLSFLSNHRGVDWISGKICMADSSGNERFLGTPFNPVFLNRGMQWITHQTWWVDKRVYNEVGLYRQDLKIAMDYDMLCRLSKFKYAYYDFISVRFDGNGISNQRFSFGLWEAYKVYKGHFGHSFVLASLQLRHILVRWIKARLR